MQKCPFPGCGYVADLVLNHHAKTHGFKNLAEMKKEHGAPKPVTMDSAKIRHARQAANQLHNASFNNIESALARLRRKR